MSALIFHDIKININVWRHAVLKGWNSTLCLPAGTYTGCDTTYTTQDQVEFELDPLSVVPIPSWMVREEPSFRWRAENNELFTLLFVDFESSVLQAAYVNIRGNDVANSRVNNLKASLSPVSYHSFINKNTTGSPHWSIRISKMRRKKVWGNKS